MLKTCFRKAFPPQVVIREDNRGRQERRAIATRSVQPEQVGLAGAQQLAQVERTRFSPGSCFVPDHIKADTLAVKLAAPKDEISKSLREVLIPKTRAKLFGEKDPAWDQWASGALARGLNKLANGPSLYDPACFPQESLSPLAGTLLEEKPKGKKLAQLNRLLLEQAFPEEISTGPKTETIWLATSREAQKLSAEEFLGANRQYWGIEETHQRLDCSALEDRLRVRDSNAAAVLGYFHRVSITLFMAWAQTQRNSRDRTYPTWQECQGSNRWLMIRRITAVPD